MTQELQNSPTIPTYLSETKKSAINWRFLAGGVLLLVFVGFLGFQMVKATTDTGAYYMTVAELQDKTPGIYGERVRVNGSVVEGTEDWVPRDMTLKFSIMDEGGDQLPIVFYGPRPDNFQRAASAIVEGELLPNGTFEAKTLLLKCPSRYEEDPEEIFVESTK